MQEIIIVKKRIPLCRLKQHGYIVYNYIFVRNMQIIRFMQKR